MSAALGPGEVLPHEGSGQVGAGQGDGSHDDLG